MALQVQRRQRQESPERWQKALARAFANNLAVYAANDTGERMVTSASKVATLHRSDGYTCTCEAALAGDRVCQHRALVRYSLGWLSPDPEPTPPTPVVPLPTRRCPDCEGGRKPVYAGHSWEVVDVIRCDYCGGTGQVPAVPAGKEVAIAQLAA